MRSTAAHTPMRAGTGHRTGPTETRLQPAETDKAMNDTAASSSLSPDTGIDDYARVRAAIGFLTRHWREQPALETLAEEMGLNPTQAQKLFHRWAG